MKRLLYSIALAAAAPAAVGQLYSEGISGDLPNAPFAAPTLVAGPGVTFLVRGIVPTAQVDVDFVTVVVPFPTTQLLFDMDHLNSPLEDGVMGVGPLGGYPLPGWDNEDDFDVALDAICGHAITPRDSLVDVGALLGNPPVIAPGSYTIAMGRTGEQFTGWDGTANQFLKLEYQLYVFARPVPGPGALAMLGLGAIGIGARRRRGGLS